MRLAVTHRTVLAYEQPIAETHMELRLRPREGAGQAVERFDLRVQPPSELRSYRDGFGNLVHYFNSVPAHERVEVVARSVVSTRAAQPDPEGTELPEDFLQFSGPVLLAPGVRAMAGLFPAGEAVERLEALARHINATLEYQPETTDISTAVDEVLAQGTGVCQDFAHLFIAVARAMGVPTRYVSGYVLSGVGHEGEGATHAWAEALVPGAGWVGYDPTNPVLASEHHIRVAVGRDYNDVAPTRGTFLGSAGERMAVEVEVAEAV